MLQPENLRYHKLWLTIGILLALVIGYKSLEPIKIKMDGFDDIDTLLHFLAYFSLAGWLQQLFTRKALITIAIAVALYSGALEMAQGLIPIREPNITDFAANVSAVVFATVLNKTALHKTLQLFENRFLPA